MTKKLIVLFAALAAVSSIYAQEQEQSVKFGVRAGLNLGKIEYGSNYSYSDDYSSESRTSNQTYSTGNLIGFHVGAVVDIKIHDFFYIQPGILLTSKGGEINTERERTYNAPGSNQNSKSEETSTIAPYYIDIPVMLSLKGTLSNDLALRAQAGPYIGFGLFGKMEEEYKRVPDEYGDSEKSEIKNVFSPTAAEKEGNEYGDGGFEGFNRVNFGIGFGVGIEFNSFYLGANYNYGLTNLYKDKDSQELYERTLGITLGYNF